MVIEVDLADLAAHAQEAEVLLKGLSNSNRLMVLCALSEGELSVTELNERVPLSQSALSQHLATLRRGGMVATRRESQTIYYRLDDPKVSVIIEALHGMFCGVASPS